MGRRLVPLLMFASLLLPRPCEPAVPDQQPPAAEKFVLTAPERNWLGRHRIVRVRISPNYPPFEFFANGRFKGMEVDYLDIVSKKLGVEFKPVLSDLSWAQVLDRFRTGESVDLILGITRTPEREKFIAFTDNYISFPQVVYTRKDGPFISGVRDLAGMKVAIERGCVLFPWLLRDVPAVQVVDVDTTEEAVAAVSTGKADAYVGNLANASYIIERRGFVNLKVAAPTHYGPDSLAMGVRKDWPEFAALINKSLRSITGEEHRKIRQRWLSLRYEFGIRRGDVVLWVIVVTVLGLAVIAYLRVVINRRSGELARETRLRASSEERFQAIFHSVNEAILMHDPRTGAILGVNQRMTEMFGYTQEEAVLLKIGDLGSVEHPDTEEDAAARVRKAACGDPQFFEWRCRQRDGGSFWGEINMRAASIGGEDRVIVTVRNVTDRKRAESALSESERRYRTLFESAGDAIFLMRDGRFIDCNTRTHGLFGCTREEIVGAFPHEFSPARQSDGRPSVESAFEKIDAALSGSPQCFEWIHVKKDGTPFNAEVTLNRVDLGSGPYLLAIVRDITDRKMVEEALRSGEERYRHIFDACPDGMVIIGPDGCIEQSNIAQSRMFLYDSPSDLIGIEATRLVAPSSRDYSRQILERRLSGENIPGVEYELIRKDGTTFYGEILATILRNGDGTVLGYIFVTRDTTERKRAAEEKDRLQEQLQQAVKMEAVGHLAGGVAHDFNNLLTAIIGYISLSLGKLPASDPVSEFLREANKAAARAASLTQQLLAFSRKQIIEPKVLDLNALIADTSKLMARLIGENIHLMTVPGEDLGLVKVDPGQFEQILVNLAVNARDAMPDGGKLLIETANVDLDDEYCSRHPYVRPGRVVLLAVSDTGHGMSEEVRKRIFEPFFTTKPMGSGTGLGLATIYGVVKQSDGAIEVYSEVGKGTTFKIYLPRVEGESARLLASDRTEELRGGTETILLVEDEEIVRELCARILERLGYRVMQAPNGDDAVALATGFGERIDLLMTDVVMPGMDGRELATRLTRIHPETRILFTSGYTDDAIVQHGVLDEGVSFIGKPYSPSALAMKVRDVLDRH